MIFSQAMQALKDGYGVTRKAWQEKYDQFDLILDTDKETILFMNEPWSHSIDQLLEDCQAQDWVILN